MKIVNDAMLTEGKVRISHRRNLIILSNEAIKIRLSVTAWRARSGTQRLIKKICCKLGD